MKAATTKPKGMDEEEGGREMGAALNLQGTVIMNVSPRVSVQSEKGMCPGRMLALLIIHLIVRGPHLRKFLEAITEMCKGQIRLMLLWTFFFNQQLRKLISEMHFLV